MADSVVEIVNTTLTSTELPDSSTSYDLITTDANTSYVIKEVQVDTLLTDLQAKINNFSVGNWAQNLTGSEVVDTSSTVSVTSSDFPVSVSAMWYAYYSDSASALTNTLGTLQGSVSGSTIENQSLSDAGFSSYYTGGGINNLNAIVFNSDKSKMFQFWADNNSTQTIRYWATPGSSYTTLTVGNYNPIWYLPHKQAIYYKYNSELRKVDIETGTVTQIGSNIFSSQSFSSYVRWTMHGDWLFCRPSDAYYGSAGSYNAQLFAINVNNGVYINFTAFIGKYGTAGSGVKLGVSYDKATDKFSLYWNDNTTSNYYLYRDIFPITKTQMESYTSSVNNNTPSVGSFHAYNTYTGITYNYHTDQFIGHPNDGSKFFYVNTAGNVMLVDYAARSEEEVFKASNVNARGFVAVYPPTESETLEVFGSNPAEIKLRITGVKSVTA